MTRDLFHEVARAYYGISPELYAMGCDSPNQYAAIPSSPGQKRLFSDVDVSPEATQNVGGNDSGFVKHIRGLEEILQPGDIQQSLGEIWPEHVNHDEAWMSLSRERPSKTDPKAFRQWWDRNKRLNTYRAMMFNVMHPKHNPI